MKKMLILAFMIVAESKLTGGKYECFDCMLTIERNKTVEQRGGPCLPPSIYEEPLTDRMQSICYGNLCNESYDVLMSILLLMTALILQ